MSQKHWRAPQTEEEESLHESGHGWQNLLKEKLGGSRRGEEWKEFLSKGDRAGMRQNWGGRPGMYSSDESQSIYNMLQGTMLERDRPDMKIPGMMTDIDAILRAKRTGNLSERQQAAGAWRLEDIAKNIPASMQNEWQGKLNEYLESYSSIGDSDEEGSQGRAESHYGLRRGMEEYLRKNIMNLGSPKQLEPRRIENDIMDDFIQQDNKYNMGE